MASDPDPGPGDGGGLRVRRARPDDVPRLWLIYSRVEMRSPEVALQGWSAGEVEELLRFWVEDAAGRTRVYVAEGASGVEAFGVVVVNSPLQATLEHFCHDIDVRRGPVKVAETEHAGEVVFRHIAAELRSEGFRSLNTLINKDIFDFARTDRFMIYRGFERTSTLAEYEFDLTREDLAPPDSIGDWRPLLRPADAASRRGALAGFFDRVVDLAGPHRRQYDFARQARARFLDGALEGDPLEYALAVVDACVLDEIRPDNHNPDLLQADYRWADNASPYARFYAYRAWYPARLLEAIQRRHRTPVRHCIVGAFSWIASRYDGNGTKGRLTDELGYWINSTGKHLPAIWVARQELYRALLEAGINPLEEAQRLEKPLRETPPPRHRRKLLKLAGVAARHSRLPAEEWEGRSTRHWANLLHRGEGFGADHALLFAGGTVANEAAIRAASTEFGGSAYLHPGWYFENGPSLRAAFIHRWAEDLRERPQVVAVNLEPVTAEPDLRRPVEPPVPELLRAVARRAADEPARTWVLLLDVTVDPLFSLTDLLGGPPPPNLVVVKTASVTKHQLGGRNYFFGAVTISAPPAVTRRWARLLPYFRDRLGGALAPGHHLNFPRPTAGWLAGRTARCREVAARLGELVPEDNAWSWLPFTLHGFLVPPFGPTEEIFQRLVGEGEERGPVGRVLGSRFNTYARRLNASLVGPGHLARFPHIEAGNSFGLDTTRVLYDQSAFSRGGARLSYGVVRVCPGYETPEEELRAYFAEMVERYARTIHRLARELGCRDRLDELLWRPATAPVDQGARPR